MSSSSYMPMQFEKFENQRVLWPQEGRHILAHYDEAHVVVYQAYKHAIADHALAQQAFGGDFGFNRMSWIKPNFLWMMFRSGWGSKEGQERILAVTLERGFFDGLLACAVASSHQGSGFDSKEAWQAALAGSDVRLQWDPDHDPFGVPVRRRAVQIGIRGATLREYATSAIVRIEDMTPFVREQHANLVGGCEQLVLPRERVYVPHAAAARNIGLADPVAS
jgi:hypothetical protein